MGNATQKGLSKKGGKKTDTSSKGGGVAQKH